MAETRYKLDHLWRASDGGLPVITRDRTVAELLELWRTEAFPNRHLSPARIAGHDWAIRILTHKLGGIRPSALTIDDIEAALTDHLDRPKDDVHAGSASPTRG